MLREQGLVGSDAKVWARHGSTLYLFRDEDLAYAIWYTNEAQDGARFDMPSEAGE